MAGVWRMTGIWRMVSSKSRHSGVWNYFDQNDQHVMCKLCQMKVSYHNSTTTMRNHMKSKHWNIIIDQSNEEKQLPITAFTTAGRPRCIPDRAEKSTHLIAKMIARDMLPLSFVEGDRFKEVLQFLEPDYDIPSRKTITVNRGSIWKHGFQTQNYFRDSSLRGHYNWHLDSINYRVLCHYNVSFYCW